ncbi:helix-turn-helix transcriptional regulator [Anaerotruncus massiliensis (ex Togo et al. 2019)]|uniref:helix-turn-helix domain-containing protein n=1 Tax=Anaerotruncus massiliensis (ex Togo et al. 2019) TaxID=1673720 RepID=UPI0027BA8E10|nr:helix-turn-helix transcriptional regulator [Anaerotruncus massiliensis (ex Togo et al. 2019)]
MDNSIFVPQNYGKIRFCFNEIMDSKGINRNQLASRAGIRFEVANRYYNGQIERMDIDVLTRICFVLDCDVGDVMKYHK